MPAGTSLVPSMTDNTDCPNVNRYAILNISLARKNGLQADDVGLLLFNGKICISEGADENKLKLLTVTHAGQADHEGEGGDEKSALLTKSFPWRRLSTNAKDFVPNFLLCLLLKCGSQIPCPLSAILHESKLN